MDGTSIQSSLEGRIAVILVLLRQGREDEVFAEAIEGCKAASRRFYRGELYADHVWHVTWAGAIERGKVADHYGQARRVLDPIARHCRECAIYGDDPPGKEHPSIDALISMTDGALSGHGTECEGKCRCRLEKLESGQWVWIEAVPGDGDAGRAGLAPLAARVARWRSYDHSGEERERRGRLES